jgi:signal peptidase II
MFTPARKGILSFLLVVLFDQISKWWIVTVVMSPPRRIPVLPFFDLVLVHNKGASFGIFANAPGWASLALIIFAILISAALLIWMCRINNTLLAIALGLVAGGAIGNVIDRLRFGAVVDFLDVYAWGWHWPAFNVADSAISVGVVLLILDSLKSPPSQS